MAHHGVFVRVFQTFKQSFARDFVVVVFSELTEDVTDFVFEQRGLDRFRAQGFAERRGTELD